MSNTKSIFKPLLILFAVLSLLAASCGDSTDEEASNTTAAAEGEGTENTGEPAESIDYKACQISDTGGIDDKSFNETAYKGVTDAEAQLGISGDFLESKADTDYVPNIDSYIADECDLIITVGFAFDAATKEAAEANPEQQFAIVDFAYEEPLPNVTGLTFATDEAAFLAGYVAAGVSETGKVATFGGLEFPTVTIFMDGFLAGVNHHNEVKGTEVEVLGWDGSEGSFAGGFDDQDQGKSLGQSFIDEGADIIMPVAGPVGLGTAVAAQEAEDVWIIGVDSDWYESAPEYKDVILTSVQKKMDVAVFDQIQNGVNGETAEGDYLGTLENGGVDIAPYHDLDAAVSDELKAEVDTLRKDIIAGTVEVSPAS